MLAAISWTVAWRDLDLARSLQHLPRALRRDQSDTAEEGDPLLSADTPDQLVVRAKYAQELRVIGQLIQQLHLVQFEVELADSDFVLRGQAPATGDEAGVSASGQRIGSRQLLGVGQMTPVEVRCTPEMMERLERQGRARRGQSRDIPDPASPSELLRTIGSYLDRQDAKPKRIIRAAGFLTLELLTAEGAERQDQWYISSLYGSSIQMYLQRRDRSA